MEKPANLGLPGARTRFDELQAIHQLQAYRTHFVVSEKYPKLLRICSLTRPRGHSSPSTA
jgi:hypothetical protein